MNSNSPNPPSTPLHMQLSYNTWVSLRGSYRGRLTDGDFPTLYAGISEWYLIAYHWVKDQMYNYK